MANRKESVMSDINFDVDSDTTKARHAQWRRLSRKRRRTLIKSTLRRLEREAEMKSVNIGMDDYSHVTSLVFSTLPYNPNGHHCSCNCLDEIQDDPELEVYGWNYGKMLKKSEMGYYGDNEEENDDVPLSDYGAIFNNMRSTESRRTTARRENTKNDVFSKENEANIGSGNESARSFMGGSLELKLDSARGSDVGAGIQTVFNSGQTTSQNGTARIDNDWNSRNGSSLSNLSRKRSRKGCLCDRLVSRGSIARNSITSEMFKRLPSQACSKCEHMLSAVEKFKHLDSSRRISLAKDDGSLRSKIFGLRQKLRLYDSVIKRNDYLTIQQKVKRKLDIKDAQLRKALGLSDSLKLMKVKESIYRNENNELEKRFEDEGSDSDDDIESRRIGHAGALSEEIKENSFSGFPENSLYRSPRKTGKSRRGTGLPALMEVDEEELREIHSSNGRMEHYQSQDFHDVPENSYDILFINHSDNEVESKSKEYVDDSFDNDELMKSWPAYKRDSLKLDLWKLEGRDSTASNRTVKLEKKASKADPVKRIVHRLDSGLSYGISSPDREIISEESFIDTKNKLDEEKLTGSHLSEEEYLKPLAERQKSFGDAIKQVIKAEISRRGSMASAKSYDRDSESEEGEKSKGLKREMSRRKSLVSDEENIKGFIEEADVKNEIVQHELRKRSDSIGSISRDMEKSQSRTVGSDNTIAQDSTEKKNESSSSSSDRIDYAISRGQRGKFVDLSTLRTLAQKHQTLQSLARLDEELYKVSPGTEKLNKYRKSEAKARVQNKYNSEHLDEETGKELPLSAKEKKFVIPSPRNKQSEIEQKIADNDKKITRIDFQYDMLRDLRFLVLDQNVSRAFSYSYLQAAPPYLKKKWQNRIKRGFLRGVKEQKVNEIQLEKVEDVTYKAIDRSNIHKETLKKRNRRQSSSSREEKHGSLSTTPGPSRLSSSRRNSNASTFHRKNEPYTLPPLKLPSSRESSPVQMNFDDDNDEIKPNPDGLNTLRGAFRKLSMRHKFIEKSSLMKNVIRLSSYNKNNNDEIDSLKRIDSERSFASTDTEERFTSRLKQYRRQSVAAQNFATSDPLSGRVSVNSVDTKRRFSLMQPLQEY